MLFQVHVAVVCHSVLKDWIKQNVLVTVTSVCVCLYFRSILVTAGTASQSPRMASQCARAHTHGYPSWLSLAIYRPALSACCRSKLKIAPLHDFTLCLFSPLSLTDKNTLPTPFPLCTGCKMPAAPPQRTPPHLFTSPPSLGSALRA